MNRSTSYVNNKLKKTIAYHQAVIDKLIQQGAADRFIPLDKAYPGTGTNRQFQMAVKRLLKYGLIQKNFGEVRIIDKKRIYRYAFAIDHIVAKETHIRRLDEWECIDANK